MPGRIRLNFIQVHQPLPHLVEVADPDGAAFVVLLDSDQRAIVPQPFENTTGRVQIDLEGMNRGPLGLSLCEGGSNVLSGLILFTSLRRNAT
jgi:hypothetical protein